MTPLPPNLVDGAFQFGYSAPGHQYEDTKANIEALTGVTRGAIAYATDTDELGTYDGAAWNWGGGGGVDTFINTTIYIPGQDGEDGESGFPGPQGPAGSTGATGATGAAGSPGVTSIIMLPGEDGEDGQTIPPTQNSGFDNEAESKKLAFIRLASSVGDIYDPGTKYGKIKSILLHNTSIADEVVTINLNDGTNTYEIYRFTLEPLETLLLEYPKGFPVNAASKITGLATDASTVTCLVSGNESVNDWAEKVLAFVQLASTKTDIYDSGTNVGIVHHILLHNIHTSSEIPTLYLHDGTNEYQITRVLLDDDPRETAEFSFPDSGFIADSSSKITGLSTTAAKVTCLVIGVQKQ